MCTLVNSVARQVAFTQLPCRWGPLTLRAFERNVRCSCAQFQETAVALSLGEISRVPLVRIHSQCLTGDVFGSLRCDCGEQLKYAMSLIEQEGAGILIYEQQEGRGIGLMAKLRAYMLQDEGFDTVEANERLGLPVDRRNYALPVEILRQLGVKSVRLISNNPMKCDALRDLGIEVLERIPCEVPAHPFAMRYLLTKKERLGHHLMLR